MVPLTPPLFILGGGFRRYSAAALSLFGSLYLFAASTADLMGPVPTCCGLVWSLGACSGVHGSGTQGLHTLTTSPPPRFRLELPP